LKKLQPLSTVMQQEAQDHLRLLLFAGYSFAGQNGKDIWGWRAGCW